MTSGTAGRRFRSVVALLALSGTALADDAWDFAFYGNFGASLFGSDNKVFDEFYTDFFSGGYMESDASGGPGAFIPLGVELWVHRGRFGVGLMGSMELNGPGSTDSGTDYRPASYREYWYFDGYGNWYYSSYYDPGGYESWSQGIGLSQSMKAVMFEYRFGESWNKAGNDNGGFAAQFGIGQVKVHGTVDATKIYNHFDGTGPLFIFGVSMSAIDKSLLALKIDAQYRTAKITDLRWDTGAPVRTLTGTPLEIGYSGFYLTLSFGFGAIFR